MIDVNLLLQRRANGLTAALGSIWIDGVPFCDSLEDLVREVPGIPVERWKIAGATAIPAGKYEVRLTVSDRAMRGLLWTPRPDFELPELLEVPGFAGVRLHAGNTAVNVEGCIAVGSWSPSGEALVDSRKALTDLIDRLAAAERAGQDVWIKVANP